MNKSLSVFGVILLIGCSKANEPIDTIIPICIQDILDNTELSKEIKTVRVQRNDNRLHYWMNTDSRHEDGFEIILNDQCDTICSLGSFIPQKCSKEYNESWITIWQN